MFVRCSMILMGCRSPRRLTFYSSLILGASITVSACGSGTSESDVDEREPDGRTNESPGGTGRPGDGSFGDGADGGGISKNDGDPVTCEEAKERASYVGCDYWPTVTPNAVLDRFHFAAVVANTGTQPATITTTGPGGFTQTDTVTAGGIKKIVLPWVSTLKGPSSGPDNPPPPKSIVASGAAYHLVSSAPVIVYQFNPIEYAGPADADLKKRYSFMNDASLLLPSTAMTGNYRVAGMRGFRLGPIENLPPVLSITATASDTTIKIKLSSTATIGVGSGVTAMSGGGTLTLKLQAGDVAQLVGRNDNGAYFGSNDFSGSIIEASAPVQVVTSINCTQIPDDKTACDHIEESVMPVQALGKSYVLATPTGQDGKAASHVVRLYGNEDNTQLTYAPKKPSGCPDTLSAGQVGECGVSADGFAVTGSKPFAIKSYMLSSGYYTSVSPPAEVYGDPSETMHPAIEQFRTEYIFLAPTDYPKRFADVVAPKGTSLTLDAAEVGVEPEPIGGDFVVFRLDLTKSGADGVHRLVASEPVGVQVLGYGLYTSFEYPAGANVSRISTSVPTVN